MYLYIYSQTYVKTSLLSIQHDNNYLHVSIYTVKPMLRGHLWGQKKCGLLRQVTS
jgi:hypothetical protein